MHGNHLKHMLIGGAGLFAVLLVVGVPLPTALLYVVFLACPLMMVMMMGSIGSGHGGGGGHGHGPDQTPERVPAQRVEDPAGSDPDDWSTPILR